jgi:hypothetical protein
MARNSYKFGAHSAAASSFAAADQANIADCADFRAADRSANTSTGFRLSWLPTTNAPNRDTSTGFRLTWLPITNAPNRDLAG